MACESASLYIAESFASRRTLDHFEDDSMRIREVTETLADAGEHVLYLESLFVSEEETVFHLFEAERADVVDRALRGADLEAARIGQAIRTAGGSGDDRLVKGGPTTPSRRRPASPGFSPSPALGGDE